MQRMYGFSGEAEKLTKERPATIKRYNTRIAMVLNADLLNIVEKTLGLFRLFAGNVFSIDDVGHVRKPQPDIFTLRSKVTSCDS
jgi:beta-phosphoglucomutase-like phosphatase (HAD superfamily)